jgi:hypothetical protein
MSQFFLIFLLVPQFLGCTFPVKNDRLDTGLDDELDEIEVSDLKNCDGDQLIFKLEFRDKVGNIIESASAGSQNELWATISNICQNDIEFDTASQCLIEGWIITDNASESASTSFLCTPQPTTHVVPSGRILRRLVSPLNDLGDGSYSISVGFGYYFSSEGGQATATGTFYVNQR